IIRTLSTFSNIIIYIDHFHANKKDDN
ncbi:hypothetical protein L6B37_10970, partial [Staphylococcus aureus]|nr:hypothetical protein [Staphylococcus aureus]MCQ9909614.1 hypothetical protein [Staphylococcus aureus]MCQ9920441.1 hypothetical protein [Staphylococcus aureus]MCQ9932795.1 hypothetical protein [Staphylococcus aureus]MCQ9954756.1 hypothetical protein [Staphylococcus aureus]